MVGKKAIPDKIKVLKGTNQKCRMRKTDLKQSNGELEYPDWLLKGAENYFDQIKAELIEIGLNSKTYSVVAAMAAERILEIVTCNVDIEENGEVDRTGSFPRSNPAVSQRNEARRHLHSLLSELGLTATAVGRLGKAREPEKKQGFGGL